MDCAFPRTYIIYSQCGLGEYFEWMGARWLVLLWTRRDLIWLNEIQPHWRRNDVKKARKFQMVGDKLSCNKISSWVLVNAALTTTLKCLLWCKQDLLWRGKTCSSLIYFLEWGTNVYQYLWSTVLSAHSQSSPPPILFYMCAPRPQYSMPGWTLSLMREEGQSLKDLCVIIHGWCWLWCFLVGNVRGSPQNSINEKEKERMCSAGYSESGEKVLEYDRERKKEGRLLPALPV